MFESLIEAVDEVVEADLGLSDLGAEVLEIDRQINRLTAQRARRLAAFDATRGYAAEQLSAASWLRAHTNMGGKAHGLVLDARVGEKLPLLSGLYIDGDITAEHLRAVSTGTRKLADSELVELDEPLSVAAQQMTPADLAHFLRQLKLAMLPELEHNRERHQERDRELVLTSGFNGMTDVHGHLTPEVGEKLRKALSAASRPDAEGELRTPVQRMADALEDLLDLTLGSGQLPDEGGERPHLVVHVDLDKLGEQPGEMNLDVPLPTCEYEETGPISAEQARRIACDSTALPIFLRGGKVVDAGYFTRTVPAPLRRLIVARDKTCPGDPVHREAM